MDMWKGLELKRQVIGKYSSKLIPGAGKLQSRDIVAGKIHEVAGGGHRPHLWVEQGKGRNDILSSAYDGRNSSGSEELVRPFDRAEAHRPY